MLCCVDIGPLSGPFFIGLAFKYKWACIQRPLCFNCADLVCMDPRYRWGDSGMTGGSLSLFLIIEIATHLRPCTRHTRMGLAGIQKLCVLAMEIWFVWIPDIAGAILG